MDNKFGNAKCKEIVENICPHCHEKLIMNKRSFANHVRWCKQNPRYEEIRKSTVSKLKLSNKPCKQDYICKCEICNKEYTVNVTPYNFEKGKYKKTCSNECAKKLTAQKTNKKEKNKKIQNKIKTLIYNKNKGKNNIHYCKQCGKLIYNTRKHFCSDECKQIYKLKDKTKKQVYKYLCKFTFSLNQFPNEFNFELIEKFGWYKAKNRGNNLLGVSRDHKYSREEGFKNLVDPYIISHPANCELLQHTLNSSKYIDCSITIEDLINNIKVWNNKYGKYPNKINYKLLEQHDILLKIKIN